MKGRIGWWALATATAVLLAASAGVGTILAVRAVGDSNVGAALGALGIGGTAVSFWWWILTSIRLRLAPPAEVAPAEVDPIGPWGVVGRALLAAMLVGFLATWLWVDVVGSRAVERAERARDEAVRLARDRGLTVADVEAARVASLTAARDDGAAHPYEDLLPLRAGRIVDVVVDGDRASILIRTDDSPPCAALDLTHDDIVRGRVTDRC